MIISLIHKAVVKTIIKNHLAQYPASSTAHYLVPLNLNLLLHKPPDCKQFK
jgi:hypothetical protein